MYYIPINDTSFELSVFWSSDTENRINELNFSDSISLSFKRRLTSVSCFCGNATYSKFSSVKKRNAMANVRAIFGSKDQNRL